MTAPRMDSPLARLRLRRNSLVRQRAILRKAGDAIGAARCSEDMRACDVAIDALEVVGRVHQTMRLLAELGHVGAAREVQAALREDAQPARAAQ